MPVKETWTAWLYQPEKSGGRFVAALTSGGVASYLMVSEPEPVFLRRPCRDPPIVTAPPSGPLYVPELHDEMPDGPPSPWKLNGTGDVYHSLPSGLRASVPPTEGGLESFATLTLLP